MVLDLTVDGVKIGTGVGPEGLSGLVGEGTCDGIGGTGGCGWGTVCMGPQDGCQKGFDATGAWTTGESDFGIAGDGPASGDKASPP